MTRLPPVVIAGKACLRHNHAAFFAAAGRTCSLPCRRRETCEGDGPRWKLFVFEEPTVSVPKYCPADGELNELNSLMINGFWE